MSRTNPPLPTGYSHVPPGQLVAAVTCLEMRERPSAAASPPPRLFDGSLVFERWIAPTPEAYRALFRAVGADWLWASRLEMSDEVLGAMLLDPCVEVYTLQDGPRQLGLVELDFRENGACELVYFGVVKEAIGRGAGRFLMDRLIAEAWAKPIRRLWLKTCQFDHPSAVAFYRRAGFQPYAFMIEVFADPRLVGLLPRTAAPGVPLLGNALVGGDGLEPPTFSV